MTDILRVIGKGRCSNCGESILHAEREFAADPIWLHEDTQEKWCHGNPVATPTPGTVIPQ